MDCNRRIVAFFAVILNPELNKYLVASHLRADCSLVAQKDGKRQWRQTFRILLPSSKSIALFDPTKPVYHVGRERSNATSAILVIPRTRPACVVDGSTRNAIS